MNTSRVVSLWINTQQEEAIKDLFQQNGWEYNLAQEWSTSIVQRCSLPRNDIDQEADTDSIPPPPLHSQCHDEECSYCFCGPCVTSVTFQQLCWPQQHMPHAANSRIRKQIYRKFWGLMANLGLWKDDRYLHRKLMHYQGIPDMHILHGLQL